MNTYAHVVNNLVTEIIEPAIWDVDDPNGAFKAGDEIPIADRFPAAFVAQLVDVTAITPAPVPGWVTTDGKTFAAPVPLAPTPDQILAVNTSQRDAFMATADAATIGMADAYVAGLLSAQDAATFKAWAAYKLALSKVDLTQTTPAWPTTPSS